MVFVKRQVNHGNYNRRYCQKKSDKNYIMIFVDLFFLLKYKNRHENANRLSM
jgi:hypothetical protein